MHKLGDIFKRIKGFWMGDDYALIKNIHAFE
jgi:hypothetical protein